MRIPFLTAYKERKHGHSHNKMWLHTLRDTVLANSRDLKDIRDKHGKTLYKLHNGFKQLFTWRNETDDVLDTMSSCLLGLMADEKRSQRAIEKLIRLQEQHLTTHVREAEIRAALLSYLHVEVNPGIGGKPPVVQFKALPENPALPPVPNSGDIIPD